MERVEKTVFLSYRRTNFPWALAIYQELTHRGYDVFIDYISIASGDFENVIIGNITSRAHFLVLLTPSALENCDKPGDWLRREIEAAMDLRRNIIPLMLEGFDFGAPMIASQLTGKLSALSGYNGLRIFQEYFFAAMERLRNEHLNIPLSAVLHPASPFAREIAEEQKKAAKAEPPVKAEELIAQQLFERANAAVDLDEKIRLFTQAIDLKPDYVYALNNRGVARDQHGDTVGAIEDYTRAVRIDPTAPLPFMNRGICQAKMGDLDTALGDFDEALRLKPDYGDALTNRGEAYRQKGDPAKAIEDCTEAIRFAGDHGLAFLNRSVARRELGDIAGADRDLAESQRLGYKPD